MHIPDGIIPVTTAVSGYAAAGGITWLSLRGIRKQYENPRNAVPRAALLAAAFFVASLIHIPIPPVSVHLVLSGLIGVMLGWFAFPVILVGLLLQAVMFQHGGLTTLGLNACIIGLPALLASLIFRLRNFFGRDKLLPNAIFAFLGAFTAIVISILMLSILLIYTIPGYMDPAAERTAVMVLSAAYMPVALIEGIFTAMVVIFLLRVQPALLENEGR